MNEFRSVKKKTRHRAGPIGVVGIDLGASHVRLALADSRGAILRDTAENVWPEAGPKKLIAQIKRGIRRLAGRGGPRAIAIGVPSPVDPRSHRVSLANNLPGWKNIDLKRKLEKEFRVPVRIENDANMAAIGEHWKGVASGVRNFVFIAIGTGLGSGVFVDGKLVRGRTGSAGELFQMALDSTRWNEDFGDTGYFEKYVSGLGIAVEGRQQLARRAKGSRSSLSSERDARFVFKAFKQGSPAARAVLEKTFTLLGVGVVNIVTVLDPDLIVLGGGVAKGAPRFMLATVRKVAARILRANAPPILLSALENKAQTYGAVFSALAAAGAPGQPGR